MRRSRPALLVPLLGLALGCAHAGGVASSSTGDITREQIAQSRVQTAYQAVQRLRPTWLQPRSTGSSGEANYPQVFVDGRPFGELPELARIRAIEVVRIRFLKAADATTRYGLGYPGGIIDVTIQQ